MTEKSLAELVWDDLRKQVQTVSKKADSNSRKGERAEIADSIPAYPLASAPLAAQGGLGDGASYVTLAWISNGRKAGEGAGLGTGVLAVYQSSTDQWLRLTDYTVVVT